MAISLFRAKVSEILPFGERFLFFRLELIEPHLIQFLAGQYILLNVPGSDAKKAYSIVSAPRLDHGIELLAELIPNGVASNYFKTLKPGQEISFYAPAGVFTVSEQIQKSSNPYIFVATGSGIAPLRSMILDLLREKQDTKNITFYWGMRYAQDLFWLEYFEELKASYSNFTLHVVLSQAIPEWPLCRGRVTDCLSLHDIALHAQTYICGNPKMIEDVQSVLFKRGMKPEQIHFERYS